MSDGVDRKDAGRPPWLEGALHTLPKEVAPDRDLWPEIAGRIAARRWNWVPAAAAASVLLSIAAALFAWQSYRTLSTANEALVAASILHMQESYRFARADFESDWRALKSQVDPEIVVVIDRNLEIIRDARHEIDEALRDTPEEPALRGLLQSTLASEIDLYRKARELAPPSI